MSTIEMPESFIHLDGVDWMVVHAVCERFHLGVEDHGLFTADVGFAGAGWGQGLSPRGLDEYDRSAKKRYGTAFGCDFLMECVRVLGSPEEAAGTRVVVFRRKPFGDIEGFARLNADGSLGEPFFPAQLAARHFPERVPA